MRRVVVTFGLISGGIIILTGVINMILWKAGSFDFDNSEIVGYTIMLIALSMVFFGIKSFRDNNLKGAITFGKGVQVGLLIALIASVIYVTGWEVYYNTDSEVRETFMERYADHYLAKMKEKGATQEEIDAATSQMNQMKESYKNPLFRIGMTFVEILPIGIVVTLISAGILRRKQVLQG